MPCSRKISQTVEAATLMPRAARSPWILRYPEEEFSRARRMTTARIERTVGGRQRRLRCARRGMAPLDQVAVPAQDRVRAYQQREVAQLVHGELVEQSVRRAPFD